jgi:hypothetical protein
VFNMMHAVRAVRGVCLLILCTLVLDFLPFAHAQSAQAPITGFCGPADDEVVTPRSALGLSEVSSLASEIEAEARMLSAQNEVTPAFLAQISEFARDSELLSVALLEADVERDLPCIFHGIAADALTHAADLQNANTDDEREAAFTSLRVLLDDAILIAPMAAGAAAWKKNSAGNNQVQ